MNAQNDIQTFFLNKPDFDKVRDRLIFENSALLESFKAETDVIALDFMICSPPVIKNIEIVKGGDFVSFWLERFKKESVTEEQIYQALIQLNE